MMNIFSRLEDSADLFHGYSCVPFHLWLRKARDEGVDHASLLIEELKSQEKVYEVCDGFYSSLPVDVREVL